MSPFIERNINILVIDLEKKTFNDVSIIFKFRFLETYEKISMSVHSIS